MLPYANYKDSLHLADKFEWFHTSIQFTRVNDNAAKSLHVGIETTVLLGRITLFFSKKQQKILPTLLLWLNNL